MNKDEVVRLGIAAQQARDVFFILGKENQQTDPAKRLEQTERYERARADMHEAANRHHAALETLGRHD